MILKKYYHVKAKLLLFSESLPNISHLCDPQSHSFIQSDRDSNHPLP